MIPVSNRPITHLGTAREALADLCGDMLGSQPFGPGLTELLPDQLPEPARELLVHHHHMTQVLGDHHGQAVELHVLDHQQSDTRYRRKIILTSGASDHVVEIGLMRLDFRYMADHVRDEILARKTPLGAILIRNNVLRHIEPRWYVRFDPSEPHLASYGIKLAAPVFGRIGTIYCDNEPAIELLEIVIDAHRTEK